MNVEVLYFEGCPNYQPAVEQVQAVLREEGISSRIRQVEVPDSETANRLRFLGSPSIRVNGVDVEPSAVASHSFGLMCRTYQDGRGRSGVPSLAMIRQAIRFQTTTKQHP